MLILEMHNPINRIAAYNLSHLDFFFWDYVNSNRVLANNLQAIDELTETIRQVIVGIEEQML